MAGRLWLRKKERQGEALEGRRGFTPEELDIAKRANLTEVAASLGFTVKRVGRYHTLKEMDSIRIYDRKSWFRWSRGQEKGQNGGSQIDFLRVFAGMDVKEAVFWLLDFMGYGRDSGWENKAIGVSAGKKEKERLPFTLPVPARDNSHLYSYLVWDRAIDKKVVDYFVKRGLIYEEQGHNNIVFKGNDVHGETRFASMRGTYDREGKGFKCDVAGNDKRYGFNIWNETSSEVMVFEAAIDLMSYVDIRGDYETNKLAMGMLSDAPLATFLEEHPRIGRISFCLDNDGPGRAAAETLMEKYYGLGYEVEDYPPPEPFKDYNQWLQAAKKCIPSHVKGRGSVENAAGMSR